MKQIEVSIPYVELCESISPSEVFDKYYCLALEDYFKDKDYHVWYNIEYIKQITFENHNNQQVDIIAFVNIMPTQVSIDMKEVEERLKIGL